MRVLLLHPTFPESFWSFGEVLKLVGRKALNPPLGLITVAAMLPKDWSLRLVDCAVRAPDEDDWTFADIVFLTGMIVQKPSMMDLIAQAKKRGIPIVVGGPYATSVPQDFVSAGVDYLVLDEAEISLAPFLAHLESAGAVPKAPDAPTLRFDAKGQKPELTETPVPRFDLLEFAAYDAMAVQYSRGCPFLCEFCDIITLYGRRPRTKTPAQILAELDCLHALGWRGGIFLVDDNFIGNKPNVKKLLPELSAWQEAHGFPFWLDTEASIDLAADIDLMAAMVQANFASVFIGIETPDEASLDLTRKHQNNRVPMLESLDLITRSGLRVMCGMIIGFDNEPSGAGQRIVEFVERAAIPTVGLSMLQVLPNTGLWTRLNREGRLLDEQLGIGQVNLLNFVPTRPVTEIGQEYVDAYRQLYDPVRYLDRTARHFQRLGLNPPFDLPPRPKATAQPRRTMRQVMAETANYAVMVRALAIVVWRQGVLRPSRGRFWRNLWSVIRTNPNRFGTYLAVCAHAEHFIPLTAIITRELEASLAQLDLEGGPARQIASTSPPLLRKPSRGILTVARPDPALPRPRDAGTKALSFGLIGVLNTVADATAFALLLWLGLPVLAANFLAWMCGVTLSYNLNSRFTFQDGRNRGRAPAWLRFAATGGAVNLLCSTLLLSGLSDVIGIWPAKALAVAIGAVLGFLAARWSIEGKA